MKRNKTSVIYHLLLLTAAIAIMPSCRAKHDLTLFSDIADKTSGQLPAINRPNCIEPENELIITVNSETPEATADFNLPLVNPAVPGVSDALTSPKLATYTVDSQGYIDFPRLGRIRAGGLTTEQLRDTLTERISEYVMDPMVSVTLTGYRIVVMGEVEKPQTITTRAQRFSVLDALAECGGLSDYGRRDNIMVMRRATDGNIDYSHLNLRQSDVTANPYFWLRNNDVVIVSPNTVKQDNSKYNQNNGYRLSVVSTVVSTVSVIASLIIALTVK